MRRLLAVLEIAALGAIFSATGGMFGDIAEGTQPFSLGGMMAGAVLVVTALSIFWLLARSGDTTAHISRVERRMLSTTTIIALADLASATLSWYSASPWLRFLTQALCALGVIMCFAVLVVAWNGIWRHDA